MRRVRPLEERFWEKVEKRGADECWRWTAAIDNTGYGRIGLGRRCDGTVQAHILMYELKVGPIPEGMFIDHQCNNRWCVNPNHLRLVERFENNINQLLRSDNTSGYRGVTRSGKTRWKAQVGRTVNGKHTFLSLGTFATPEDAASAVRDWRRQHWNIRERCNI